MDFHSKINFTNGLIVLPKPVKTFTNYRYRIRRGNNSSVVKQIIKTRWWWTKADKKDGLDKLNLYWVCGPNHRFIKKILHPNLENSYQVVIGKSVVEFPKRNK